MGQNPKIQHCQLFLAPSHLEEVDGVGAGDVLQVLLALGQLGSSLLLPAEIGLGLPQHGALPVLDESHHLLLEGRQRLRGLCKELLDPFLLLRGSTLSAGREGSGPAGEGAGGHPCALPSTQFSALWGPPDTPSPPSPKHSDHFTAQLSRDLAGHCH